MSWESYLVGPAVVYLMCGVVTAVMTMRVFPPMKGYRPPVRVRILAALTFVMLWPVLAVLAAWYKLTCWYQCRRKFRSRGLGSRLGITKPTGTSGTFRSAMTSFPSSPSSKPR